MAIYLYTSKSAFSNRYGLTVEEGIPLSEERPDLEALIQGVSLELRLPDGTRRRTHLANYGVGVTQQEDGSYLMPENPCLRFTLPTDLLPDDVPNGTEIWWLENEPNLSEAEVKHLMKPFEDDDES